MAENAENISSANSDGSNKKEQSKITQEEDSRYVFIKFVDQKGNYLTLRVGRNATLGAAFDTYCKSKNLEAATFMHNGTRLSPNLTPIEMNFRNAEQIDVFGTWGGG